MTLPDERTRAILWARAFLLDLMDPAKTPRVPRAIRRRAYSVLKHYPGWLDMKLATKGHKVFGEPEKGDRND